MYPYMKEIKSSLVALVSAWALILVPIVTVMTVTELLSPPQQTEA